MNLNLMVGGRGFALAQVQAVQLVPSIGAYELVFNLDLQLNPQGAQPAEAAITGARVNVRTDTTGLTFLGFARPDAPFHLGPAPSGGRAQHRLVLPLQPNQVAALERFRNARDLVFQLTVAGAGSTGNIRHAVQEQWDVPVARSEWIKQLQGAKAKSVLLVEIPLDQGDPASAIAKELAEAERFLRQGDFRACVSSCRAAFDQLGTKLFGTKEWIGPALAQLAAETRRTMTRSEREVALLAAARHFTHPAHHPDGESSADSYSRSEAELMLTITAALVGRAQST